MTSIRQILEEMMDKENKILQEAMDAPNKEFSIDQEPKNSPSAPEEPEEEDEDALTNNDDDADEAYEVVRNFSLKTVFNALIEKCRDEIGDSLLRRQIVGDLKTLRREDK